MVSDARHEIFIMRDRSHNRGDGVRGFDLQRLRRLNHADQFLPSVATRKLTLTLPGRGKKRAVRHFSLLTHGWDCISTAAYITLRLFFQLR